MPAAWKTRPTYPETGVRVVTRLPYFSIVASCRRSRSRIGSSHSTLTSAARQRSASAFCSTPDKNEQKTWPRIAESRERQLPGGSRNPLGNGTFPRRTNKSGYT